MNANVKTAVFGALFGASIILLVLYGLHMKFGWNIPTKWYVIPSVVGAGLSLFFGQKNVSVDEKGVLSFFDNYMESLAAPGFYWELPGVIGIKTVSAKQTTVKIAPSDPKLNDDVTLLSAEGSITYVVENVRIAAAVDDLGNSVKSLAESALRSFIATKHSGKGPGGIENSRTDLLASLPVDVLNEADQLGIKIKSLFLESAKLPPELVKARNQKKIEEAERAAQDLERAQRKEIIDEEMAKGATYAEAQAEADRITGKRSTVTTTQVTGSGARPVVVLGQNQQGGNSSGNNNGNGGSNP